MTGLSVGLGEAGWEAQAQPDGTDRAIQPTTEQPNLAPTQRFNDMMTEMRHAARCLCLRYRMMYTACIECLSYRVLPGRRDRPS
jgi:hypothetical protein